MALTILDSGVLIGFLDRSDLFHEPALGIVAGRGQADRLALPLVAYAEVSVGIARAGGGGSFFDAILDRLVIEVPAATREIGALAAQMRAGRGARSGRSWRLPDALVVATAIVHGAGRIVTTDANWPALTRDLPEVVVLQPSTAPGADHSRRPTT